MRRIEMRSFAAIVFCMLGSAAVLSGTDVAAAQPVFRLASLDLPLGKLFREEFVANDFGCHGGNRSPALQWSGAPPGTKSFAVTMYDPYKPPQSGWWHWIVYDLPASTAQLDLRRTPARLGEPGCLQEPGRARRTAMRRNLTIMVRVPMWVTRAT